LSTRTPWGYDNWTMSSKIITTVFVAMIVGPFAYISATDAMSIKQHLQKQTDHIQQLSVESEKLDQEITKTLEVKERAEQEVQQIEKQTQEILSERERLEAELGAN